MKFTEKYRLKGRIFLKLTCENSYILKNNNQVYFQPPIFNENELIKNKMIEDITIPL